jgi:Rieske Fe-S protein
LLPVAPWRFGGGGLARRFRRRRQWRSPGWGQLFAFQEFCTHRFGPLSEGSFHDGEVQCPWHGSCFDVRTGKVTRGPATVNLKTYRVMVTEGTIHIDLQPAVPLERERLREMAAGNGRRQKEAVGAQGK